MQQAAAYVLIRVCIWRAHPIWLYAGRVEGDDVLVIASAQQLHLVQEILQNFMPCQMCLFKGSRLGDEQVTIHDAKIEEQQLV